RVARLQGVRLSQRVRQGFMRIFPAIAIVLVLAVGQARAEEPKAMRLIQTIPLPGVEGRIDHMAADANGTTIYIAALGNNSVEVVGLKAGKVIKSISGPQKPTGIRV